MVWEVYSRKDGIMFTLCDGYPDFLCEPGPPACCHHAVLAVVSHRFLTKAMTRKARSRQSGYRPDPGPAVRAEPRPSRLA